MEYPGTTPHQKEQVAEWIQVAFDRLAYHVTLSPTATSSEIAALVCGKEFARIILLEIDHEVDLPRLRVDLYKLMRTDCPPVDLVELLIRFTTGAAPLDVCWQLVRLSEHHHYVALKGGAEAVESELCILRLSLFGESSLLFTNRLPDVSPEQLKQIEALRQGFQSLIKWLAPPKSPEENQCSDKFWKDYTLALLYLLLKHFGRSHGYPTMSRLLKTMRRVWERVGEPALKDVGEVTAGAEQWSPIGRDVIKRSRIASLSQFALEKRLLRFFSQNPIKNDLQKVVERYLSELAEKQQRGDPLPRLFGQIRQSTSANP